MFGAPSALCSGVGFIFGWGSRLNVPLSDSPENGLRELTRPPLNSVVKSARETTVAAEGHDPCLHISTPALPCQ